MKYALYLGIAAICAAALLNEDRTPRVALIRLPAVQPHADLPAP
jgi:hypothetical protein